MFLDLIRSLSSKAFNTDEPSRVLLTILSVIVISILWFSWKNLKLKKEIEAPLPPGPYGLPIIGYLPFLGTDLHQIFAKMAGKYGPIFKLWLGKRLCVVITSPSLAREVAREKDTIFANRYPNIALLVVTYGAVDIAWTSYGPYWQSLRKIFVREMLNNANLNACYDLRKSEVWKTMREVNKKIGEGVNIGELACTTELNVVINLLWGTTFDTEKVSVINDFRAWTLELMEGLSLPNVSDFFPALARFDIQGIEKKMKKLLCSFEKFVDSMIDERRKNNMLGGEEIIWEKKKRRDLLQLLLDLKEQQDTVEPITLTQIKALLMDIVVGGTDTTATSVEWAMAEIMNNKEIMKKVQQELSEIVGTNKVVEESHIPDLKYLDAVMKETFRLHPAIPFLVPRRPSETCVIGGYTIPKGTKVFINVWAVHRDPEIWDSPNEFKPERFLGNDGKWDYNGNNFQYLPFGSGRRICAGIPLAEKMVMYVLASLLHCFNWEIPKGEELDLSEKFGLVLRKRTPLIAIPTPRFSSSQIYA